VVEDTPTTIQDIERLFNPKVAQLVEGLTKISMVQKDLNASLQAENFRKMILTLNDDVRVILIKPPIVCIICKPWSRCRKTSKLKLPQKPYTSTPFSTDWVCTT
jgi:hypothetical protein